jgi:hypothetical protein
MNVRELLQIEIWSKETSRKILEPIRKILFWIIPSRKNLIRIGIVLGILVVVLGIAFVIETHWTTAGERKVANDALAKIDAMQNLVQANGNDFETRDQQAKQIVEAADRAAWTIRDRQVAFLLSFYLSNIEQTRRDIEIRAMMQERKIHRSDRLLENDKKWDAMNLQTRFELRSLAQKLLQ